MVEPQEGKWSTIFHVYNGPNPPSTPVWAGGLNVAARLRGGKTGAAVNMLVPVAGCIYNCCTLYSQIHNRRGAHNYYPVA